MLCLRRPCTHTQVDGEDRVCGYTPVSGCKLRYLVTCATRAAQIVARIDSGCRVYEDPTNADLSVALLPNIVFQYEALSPSEALEQFGDL